MIQSAYAKLCFKLRHFVPCVVCRVQVRIALPADATVELLLTGEAGVGSVDGVCVCVCMCVCVTHWVVCTGMAVREKVPSLPAYALAYARHEQTLSRATGLLSSSERPRLYVFV